MEFGWINLFGAVIVILMGWRFAVCFAHFASIQMPIS